MYNIFVLILLYTCLYVFLISVYVIIYVWTFAYYICANSRTKVAPAGLKVSYSIYKGGALPFAPIGSPEYAPVGSLGLLQLSPLGLKVPQSPPTFHFLEIVYILNCLSAFDVRYSLLLQNVSVPLQLDVELPISFLFCNCVLLTSF